jgi:hypothetical protein
MSVKDRMEDSKLLFHAGRLEGALTSVLLAAADTSRLRYPRAKIQKDGDAFVQFLTDERAKITGAVEVQIAFCGEVLTLESLLYKFVRNSLVHESELDDHVSFEYGDFLLDKGGTTDQFTFSSELVLRLSYAVESAPENGLIPASEFDHLPEPIRLTRIGIVKYTYGDLPFEFFCYACSVVSAPYKETGEDVVWLNMRGVQTFRGEVRNGPNLELLVPAKYITSIGPGPEFTLPKRRTRKDIGIFPPIKPPPANNMLRPNIEAAVSSLQIPQVEMTITVRRPHYELIQQTPSTEPTNGTG